VTDHIHMPEAPVNNASSSPDSEASALLDAGFLPACPECRYDLRSLPDGPCPECGRPFNYNGLLANYLRKRTRPRSDLLLLLAIFLSVVKLAAPAGQGLVFVDFLVCCVALVWIVRHRASLWGDKPRRLLWLLIPAGSIGIGYLSTPLAIVALPLSGILIFGILRLALRSTAQAATIFGIAAAPIALVLGAAISFRAVLSRRAGYWSTWDSPWPRERWSHLQPAYARVMTNTEVLRIGQAMIVLSILLALAAYVCWRYRRRSVLDIKGALIP
jgi:hypothetical protein